VAVFGRRLITALRQARRLAQRVALALVAIGLFAGGAPAQLLSDSERSELEARKDALFQQVLRDPANLDLTFAYAETSARLGDNEAAVSALERMLLFNPDLPRVQLELGTLYFRMGSFDVARTHFERALAADPPLEVRSRVETYLAEISRHSDPHRFSGFLFLGGQYQSNANLAPGSPLIRSPIGDVLLNSEFVKRADVNMFGSGALLYSYDLGTQDHDTFEVAGSGFANRYNVVDRLDLGLVEATAGPRFNFAEPVRGVRAAALKPYLIANNVRLGGNPYFRTLGLGGEASALVWQDIRLRSLFEFRNKNFSDAPDRPLSRGLTGSDKLFSLSASRAITAAPASELMLQFDFLSQDTRLAYFSNKTYAGSLGYRIRYGDPTGYLRFPWETTLFVSGSWAGYGAPDPCCNTSSDPALFIPAVRSDRRVRFGLTQSFQLSNSFALVVQLQRDIVSSNLPLYRYTGNSVLFGPQLRF
jgi:tetratricopeptide (TPR) repeat protein